jgi:hypothetical protein
MRGSFNNYTKVSYFGKYYIGQKMDKMDLIDIAKVLEKDKHFHKDNTFAMVHIRVQ